MPIIQAREISAAARLDNVRQAIRDLAWKSVYADYSDKLQKAQIDRED
jgi:hypothetical protein